LLYADIDNYLQSTVLGDGEGVLNLTFFTFLVLFLLCPVAMQLFGGDFDVVAQIDEEVMRFDNFYQGFLSLFQVRSIAGYITYMYPSFLMMKHPRSSKILTGEDWTVSYSALLEFLITNCM
jgi:hypothetical protein